MVSVKSLWEIWKSFTNIVSSSANGFRSYTNGNNNGRVRYCRLRPRIKSQSAHNFMEMTERKKSLPTSSSFPQTRKTSKLSCGVDQNSNRLSVKDEDEENGWSYGLDNSDSDFCDEDQDIDIPTSDEDSSDFDGFRSSTNGNNNGRVRYCRLRPRIKSQSAHNFIEMTERKNSLPTSSSFPQTRKTSKLSCGVDQNSNCLSPLKDEDEENGWSYGLDNSDSDFCDEDQDIDIPTSDEDSSDFEDEEEEWTCEVCDKSFATEKKLNTHQTKMRHFGCLQCDSIFTSRSALSLHREEMDHYDYDLESSSEDEDDEFTCHSPEDKLI